MGNLQRPRLRQASKTSPLYPLNKFPADFVRKLAQHICIRLATRGDNDLEGKDWENIFANCVGAKWTPSNIGLDDITHNQSSTAWGAKTLKGVVGTTSSSLAAKKKVVRLISGRNSPTYSYGSPIDPTSSDPRDTGKMVVDIWNERVKDVRSKFENLRTVVLIKDKDLSKVAVFEFDTDMYMPESFSWKWNSKGNLEGHDEHGFHRFTWQPHGSQFTILEEVPEDALRIQIKRPKLITPEDILNEIGFDETFYTTI